MVQVVINREALREMFNAVDLTDDQIRWNYRGSGMWRPCVGVVGNVNTLVTLVTFASMEQREAELVGSFSLDHVMNRRELRAVHDVLTNEVRTDQLGLDHIFYWPRLEVATTCACECHDGFGGAHPNQPCVCRRDTGEVTSEHIATFVDLVGANVAGLLDTLRDWISARLSDVSDPTRINEAFLRACTLRDVMESWSETITSMRFAVEDVRKTEDTTRSEHRS